MTSDQKEYLIFQARLEMLKNDARGMIAMNEYRQHCGDAIAYSDDAFAQLNQQIANLVEEIKNL